MDQNIIDKFSRLSGNDKIRVLFVCLGNICRSPAADGIFRDMVHKAGLDHRFEIDSAGTGGYHVGDLPDRRMRIHGRRRGYEFDHICRQVSESDFDNYDLIIGMDDNNVANLRRLAPTPEAEAKIAPMAAWVDSAMRFDHIPDPYYDGAEGFETVLDLLENGCNRLLTSLTPPRKPLIGRDLAGLREVASEVGLPAYAATQMADWLYKHRVTDIEQMTNLSKKARERLSRLYCVGREAPLFKAESADGTVKYLFNGCGRRDIESVYIPDHDRATLCVSSQAGCRMGCKFCMTGRGGFQGNLTPAQIINQVLSVDNSEDLTNIVFMGMGEPLDNLDAVLAAIDILTAPWGLAWSPKRITVSTVGYLPALRRLLSLTKVHVAVSAHSPFADERASLMPVEKSWPLKQVVDLLREYDFAHQRRLSVEYIVWAGLNDDLRHADALAKLLRGTSARVNLIRFHAIPDSPLRPASMAVMEAFRDRLNQLGVTSTIRASRGEDIMAACGQLAGRAKN